MLEPSQPNAHSNKIEIDEGQSPKPKELQAPPDNSQGTGANAFDQAYERARDREQTNMIVVAAENLAVTRQAGWKQVEPMVKNDLREDVVAHPQQAVEALGVLKGELTETNMSVQWKKEHTDAIRILGAELKAVGVKTSNSTSTVAPGSKTIDHQVIR